MNRLLIAATILAAVVLLGPGATLPAGAETTLATTPTVSSVVSCLERGGAYALTIPAKPPGSGTVLATAPSGVGFGVYLFRTGAQASGWVAHSRVPRGDSLYKGNGGRVQVILAAASGVRARQAVTLISACTGPHASSVASTARSNPNTRSGLVACLHTAQVSNLTTPTVAPAVAVVLGTTPPGPGFGVFLFDNIAQAQGFAEQSPATANESLLAANGGVTLVYINNRYGAAALSAAKTLLASCIK